MINDLLAGLAPIFPCCEDYIESLAFVQRQEVYFAYFEVVATVFTLISLAGIICYALYKGTRPVPSKY